MQSLTVLNNNIAYVIHSSILWKSVIIISSTSTYNNPN
jgi:hypothetical protein